MSAEGPVVAPMEQALQTCRWSVSTRVAFRFCFVYLGLFCLTTQIVTSLLSAAQGEVIPDGATVWPMRGIVLWTAAHVFHTTATLSGGGNSGSGDFLFGWVLVFCLLVLALVSTALWSFADRGRDNYANLHKWFVVFIRFALAGQLLNYGIAKVIPVQMPFPYLDEAGAAFLAAFLRWAFFGHLLGQLRLTRFLPVAWKCLPACC